MSLEIISTPEGDLAKDIQHDYKFPKEINSFEELFEYLPNDDAIQDAAKNLFRSYLEEKHHHS